MCQLIFVYISDNSNYGAHSEGVFRDSLPITIPIPLIARIINLRIEDAANSTAEQCF